MTDRHLAFLAHHHMLGFFQVKADVQNVSGELIVSGLDSATSLIQAAKNLMNAVVLTVKSCYVASTKYPRLAAEGKLNQQKPVVVWKMKVRSSDTVKPDFNKKQSSPVYISIKVTRVRSRKYVRV